MEALHVIGCPFCDIFEKLVIPGKLYYPEQKKIQEDDDFVIINYLGKHIVIVTDHVDSVSKHQWGRIIFKCKEIYGPNTKLKVRMYPIQDHWHAEIQYDKHKGPKLKDLRVKNAKTK